MHRLEQELARLGGASVQTSAQIEDIAVAARLKFINELDHRMVHGAGSHAPPAGLLQSRPKKFGGSLFGSGPRGAEDPGNPPDVRS
jgi:hypothetical protein